MRESIGGGWLFSIVIVFIFLFSGFLAYSISYTKAFNVKNEVINYIEHNEGYTKPTKDISNVTDKKTLYESTEGKIKYLVTQVGYDFEADNSQKCETENGEKYDRIYGVCIIKYCPNGKRSNVHYKVTTYMRFGISSLGLSFTIPISGETRSIYDDRTTGIDCPK